MMASWKRALGLLVLTIINVGPTYAAPRTLPPGEICAESEDPVMDRATKAAFKKAQSLAPASDYYAICKDQRYTPAIGATKSTGGSIVNGKWNMKVCRVLTCTEKQDDDGVLGGLRQTLTVNE